MEKLVEPEVKKYVSLFHPDRVLTRFDEITVHDIVRENVGEVRAFLSVETMHLPDNDPVRVKVNAEIQKLQEDYHNLNMDNIDEYKIFGRYLYKRLKEIDDGKI